jgi:uncharacterized protein (DUF2062 family)
MAYALYCLPSTVLPRRLFYFVMVVMGLRTAVGLLVTAVMSAVMEAGQEVVVALDTVFQNPLTYVGEHSASFQALLARLSLVHSGQSRSSVVFS